MRLKKIKNKWYVLVGRFFWTKKIACFCGKAEAEIYIKNAAK